MAVEVVRNGVLRQLSVLEPNVYARFRTQIEPTALERGATLGAARKRSEWVYFVESGLLSLVAATHNGNSVGVAIVGHEGVAGVTDALGGRPLPYAMLVQVPGLAYRVRKAVIEEHIFACTALHELLMAYMQYVMHQLSQSAVCNRFHTGVERLARWLLLTADRAGIRQLALTHEFVAQMVGAPRSGVTQAADFLRSKGIIEYSRGVLTIRNVKQLRNEACECFDVVKAALNGSATERRRTKA